MARVEAAATPDVVIAALRQDGGTLLASLGGSAYTRVVGDAELIVSHVPLPTLNGVLTLKVTASADDVASLLDVVAGENLAHSLMLRPGCAEALTELARRRGMVADEELPLMVLGRATESLERALGHGRLSIRVLRPDEVGVHQKIAAAGFEAPLEIFESLVNRRLLEMPGQRAYVGEVDGVAVTTALASTLGDHVGIFDVATPPPHRGQGYGAAITARAALDGFESGASFAYLQSSPMGYGVYERLGFRTIERWEVWISGSPSHS